MHRARRRAGARLAPLVALTHLAALATVAFAASPAAALSPQALEGRAVMEKAQCTRCHAVTDASAPKDALGHGIAPIERAMNCVTCHQWILNTKGDAEAIARQRQTFPDWDRYLETIVHFRLLPDLGTLTRRVDPAFVRRFLDAPFDLRPHLDESMIPLRLSAAEKDAVVAYLTALNGAAAVKPAAPAATPPAKAPDAQAIATGRQAFLTSGCPTCHVMGPEPLVPGYGAAFFAAMGDQALLAPDLRFVRQRIPRATLVAFIQNPTAIDPTSRMPALGVTAERAGQIADFLLHAPLPDGAAPEPAMSAAKPLAREVGWDEVYEEVLGLICVHCHMHPESNNGDGGAGNTGGLGFAGLQLDLETYAGVKRGLVRDGKRVSIVDPPAPGQPPLLLAALLRRHAEAGRDVRPPYSGHRADARGADPQRPGMPLGLPPLPPEKVRMIATWLAQGAPGPGG